MNAEGQPSRTLGLLGWEELRQTNVLSELNSKTIASSPQGMRQSHMESIDVLEGWTMTTASGGSTEQSIMFSSFRSCGAEAPTFQAKQPVSRP